MLAWSGAAVAMATHVNRPVTSVQTFCSVRTDRRLLSVSLHVLNTTVPCENSLASNGLLLEKVLVFVRSIK